MMPFSIIVAMDLHHGIGKAGMLPWHLPQDMKHFKTLTTESNDPQKQNVVIMGRKTWAAIPKKFRPLPDRINVVLTRNPAPQLPPEVFFADSIEKALCLFEHAPQRKRIADVFVIGGEQIYTLALKMPACKKLYLTQIKHIFDCDTFFPDFETQFKQKNTSETFQKNNISYSFFEYQSKR